MGFEFNSSTNYLMAWAIYLFSAAGLCVVFWRSTRWINFKGFRRFLRASIVVALFTPVVIAPDKDWMAPAYLVALYEYGLGNYEMSQKAGLVMLIGIVVILLGLKLEFIVRKIWHLQEES